MYRFPDGSIHDIREVKPQKLSKEDLRRRAKLGAHNRRHVNKGIQKTGCTLCFPEGQK